MSTELMTTIDDITREQNKSEIAVLEATIIQFEKQRMILEECDNESVFQESGDGKKSGGGIISKIIGVIKSFFKMLRNKLDMFVTKFNLATKHKSESATSILLRCLQNSKYNQPDDIKSWPIPKPNPKYLKKHEEEHEESNDEEKDVVTESFKEEHLSTNGPIKVSIPAGPGSMFIDKMIEVPTDDICVGFDNDKESLTFHCVHSGKKAVTTVDSTLSGPKEDITRTKNPYFGTPKTALYLIKNPHKMDEIRTLVDQAFTILRDRNKDMIKDFNKKCEKTIDNILHEAKKINTDDIKITLKDITSFQKELNNQVYKMDHYVNSDETMVSDFDKDTIKSFNFLADKLLRIQISMNMLTSAIDEKNIINSAFIGEIKNVAILDIFVNECIKAGIPPKYIAYNTWLVSDPCIRGNGAKWKPVWGQTRAVLFPPAGRVVYKIALSGSGITSNDAEVRVSKLFVDMDRVDLIAPIVRTWKNGTIVAMEAVKSKGTPSYAAILNYSKEVNSIIKDYEAKSGKKLNIKISDQHKDNVMYDTHYGCYRSIDYGIGKRVF